MNKPSDPVQAPPHDTVPSDLSWSLLLAGMVAFLSLGLLQAMYGPAFGLFMQKFGVTVQSVALISSAHFVGSASAPLLVALALPRFGTATLVKIGLPVLMLGVIGVAFASSWSMALACALVAGLGLGTVGATLNSAYAPLGTRAINLVNAVFGVGSILSPLAVLGLGSLNLAYPLLLVALAAGCALLLVQFKGVPALPVRQQVSVLAGQGLPLLLFMLLMACYVGLEVGLGAWARQHLEGSGVSSAALIVSGYWLGLTVSRVVVGFAGGSLSRPKLVLCGAVIAALSVVLSFAVPALIVPAYLLAGLAFQKNPSVMLGCNKA